MEGEQNKKKSIQVHSSCPFLSGDGEPGMFFQFNGWVNTLKTVCFTRLSGIFKATAYVFTKHNENYYFSLSFSNISLFILSLYTNVYAFYLQTVVCYDQKHT